MKTHNMKTRNTISLAGSVFCGKPQTLVARGNPTYTIFDLLTFGSYRNRKGEKVDYSEVHHIVCVGTLDIFARSIKNGAEIEVEGELCTRRHATYIGDPAEVEVIHWRREVVATSLRPHMSVVAEVQKADVDEVLIALYRPEES